MTDNDETPTDAGQSWYRQLPWWRMANVIAVITLLVVVVPFVIYAAPQLVGGEHSYVVLSGSMQPTMGPGDVIVVGATPATAISDGDVITFRRAEEARPTTHRVVEVLERDGEPAFRTAGDNNEDPDPELVRSDQLIGTVLSVGGHLLVIPFIGRVIMFSGTQTGFLLLAVLPMGLFVLNELWGVIAAMRPSDNQSGDQPETTPDTVTDESSAVITFSADELRLGLVIMLPFLGYSAWVAYATVESWALGAVAAVSTTTLLLGGLYVFGSTPASDSPPSPAPPEGSGESLESDHDMPHPDDEDPDIAESATSSSIGPVFSSVPPAEQSTSDEDSVVETDGETAHSNSVGRTVQSQGPENGGDDDD